MRVSLHQVSKRFGAQKVLEKADLVLESGSITGVTGANGSGKSTLLQIIAGALKPDNGSVAYSLNKDSIDAENIFRHVSISAPYLNLYDDLSLRTALDLHFRFKKIQNGLSNNDFFERTMLVKAKEKAIHELSSGMLQRFKLGLAIMSDTPLLLLDEPGSNLDAAGLEWYRELLASFDQERTVLICSNREEEELRSCQQVIKIEQLRASK